MGALDGIMEKYYEVVKKIYAKLEPLPPERRKRQLYSHLIGEPWKFMTDYTPQREWIEGAGKFIWLALFLTELGAGVYFFSLMYNNVAGMFLGWVICVIFGCTSFLLHTGHPERLYRAVTKITNSWISRGFTFVSIFTVFGFLYMLYAASGGGFFLFKFLMAIVCLVVSVYAGMVLAFCNGMPLWNTGLVPAAFMVAALWGGAEILLSVHILTGLPIESIEHWVRFLIPFFTLIIVIYLYTVWTSSDAGKASVKRMLMGDLSKYFYIGVVLIGLCIPLLVWAFSFTGATGAGAKLLYLLSMLCGLTGDLTMRYCIMKGGYYSPLL